MRDPFYNQIIDYMGGELDPKLFQDCVIVLLQDTYPGLVPMRGGIDAGMDGAIADGKGEPFPLVATTEEDVIGNLTNSLNSYAKSGRKRREVVLATSRLLTPKRIQNLYDRANELGFTLHNVHTRDDIASRLYRNPDWCLALLNLPGRPSALSQFSKSDRPLLNKTLIGRDKELEWLREIKGDCLLVGHPGSGKSFLLHQFALKGGGLFVVEDDLGDIAAAIRSQEPTMLLLDDAQLNLQLLKGLKHLCQELGVDFSILASCWHGDEDMVAQTMNLSENWIFRLELLTRSEIVKVVNDAGLIGPKELLREIVNQAEGRPGLAATLVHLCLQGGVKEVVLGDALRESVQKFFKPRLGFKAIYILASFSVGGNAGMSLRTVTDYLQMKIIEVREIAVELAAGGIIWETRKDNLSVRPPALRHALVREVFFQGALSLPIQPLIDQSTDVVQTANMLVGAYSCGADVPDSFLRNLLERANSLEVWEYYAWQGPKEASWIIENYPEYSVSLARPTLEHIPEIAIPRLLQASIGDNRLLQATLDHPLRMIDDWVKSAWPGKNEAVLRRELLIRIVCTWIKSGEDATTGCKALISAFSPTCEDISNDPGDGNTVTIRNTLLLLNEMREVFNHWSEVLEILMGADKVAWQPIQEIAEVWAYPQIFNIKMSHAVVEFMKSSTAQILMDIVSLAKDHPGILHWANQLSHDTGLCLSIPTYQEFECLYPIKEKLNWRDSEVKHQSIVQTLGKEWIVRGPHFVAKKIAWIETEAILAGIKWSRWTPYLCAEISNAVDSPTLWVNALIDEGCSENLILPFLSKSVETNEDGWRDLIGKCLAKVNLRSSAISIILTMGTPPEEIVAVVLGSLSGYEQLIQILCLRGEVPIETLRHLLQHEDEKISSNAAYGVWYSDPKGIVNESVKNDWRNAVVQSRQENLISPFLENNTDLAYDWLNNFLKDDISDVHNYGQVINVAISLLESEVKECIMKIIPPKWSYVDLVQKLIGNNTELYQQLLHNSSLKMFHLVPLIWQIQEVWVEKAKLALEAGYSPKDIAKAAYGFPFRSVFWTGKESIVRKEWVERFESLCSHNDERIRNIGIIGKNEAEEELLDALRREHEEDVFGFRAARRLM